MTNKNDEKFVREAIKEAEKAKGKGERPYGAVLVKNNKVIAKAHNTKISDKNPIAHAELNVIKKACRKLKTEKLEGYTLYTNVEPCPMCAAACVWAGIKRIVYGASIKDLIKLGRNQIKMTCKEVTDKGFRKIGVFSGILKKESLKHFQT